LLLARRERDNGNGALYALIAGRLLEGSSADEAVGAPQRICGSGSQ
jgi:hypothetical protein